MKYNYAIEKTVIEPRKSAKSYLKELWRYRELLLMLCWRDIKVKYKQTYLGILWTLIRPAITLLIFTLLFSTIARFPSEGDLPYPLMVLAGLLPWQFFTQTVSESSNSLIQNQNLITKVYFPKVIIITASFGAALIDFCISLTLLGFLAVFYSHFPTSRFLLLPLMLIPLFTLSLGFGLLLSANNIKYRDFRYIIPFILQIGFYASPIGYTSSVLPFEWQKWYAINPIVGIVDAVRWSLTVEKIPFPIFSFSSAIFLSILLFLLGWIQFRKVERFIADLI